MTTAERIYNALYGDIDDKSFRNTKLTEIEDWLAEGDAASRSLDSLIDEFREYDTIDDD